MSVVDLETTVIGAYPKPSYLKIPDWFAGSAGESYNPEKKGLLGTGTAVFTEYLKTGGVAEDDILKATSEVLEEQAVCGVDVPTDGEIRRENYIHFLCRFIQGIDFENLEERSVRSNAFKANIPTVTGPVSWRDGLSCAEEWKKAQELSKAPVKYTLPGPMTIIGSVADVHYNNDEKLSQDLALVLQRHVSELVEAGCKYIQIDEPLFARKVDDALNFGIKNLDTIFAHPGCADIQKSVHMCCGYPARLDQVDFPKAPADSYFKLAPAIDASKSCDAVSIEDAHRKNDLTLLALFKQTKVIFGLVDVANSQVEPVEQLRARLQEALQHIDADRLIVAPDCGWGLFSKSEHRGNVNKKLANMCQAAKGLKLCADIAKCECK